MLRTSYKTLCTNFSKNRVLNLSVNSRPTMVVNHSRTMMDQNELHEKLQARKWYDGLLPAVIGVAGISAAFLYFNTQSQEHTKKLRNKKKEGQVQSYGKALIGGPFELVRGDNGETCNEDILKNKWTLLYFGFNFCPDVCPDEMEKMADANRLLSRARTENKEHYETEKIADHQCIYISIDPKRDTPKRADDYAKTFHDKFIGLSGSFEQIDHASKQFRVYYSRAPNDFGEDEYLVDHTIVIYSINPEGEFEQYFLQKKSAVEIAMYLQDKMDGWNERKEMQRREQEMNEDTEVEQKNT